MWLRYSLWSIAKQIDDPMCLLALETIAMLGLKNPLLCLETGCLQVLLSLSLHFTI